MPGAPRADDISSAGLRRRPTTGGSMYRGKRISVVIPCHNEEDGIAAVLAQMPPIVDEVVVVDNCSTDRTAEVATRHGGRVVPEPRKGYGYAHKAGYAAARGDIVVTMDGDGTYPPDSIPLLLYVMFEEKVDFITARRWYSKNGETKSPIRLLGNAILSGTMMALYFRFIVDSQSGMWMFKKDILGDLDLTSNGMALSEEIKIEAFTHPGVRAIEIPIYYGQRIGESKLNIWRDGFYNLFFLVKKRLKLRRKQPRLRAVEPVRAPEPEVEERRASAGN
jgi:glycosyltransferase involved in cell wall biosynthesis